MVDVDEAARHRGSTVEDADGMAIGEVAEVYVDDDSGEPAWLLVDTEDAGSHFVPLAGADLSGDGVRIAFPREQVMQAAGIQGDRHLDADEERDLYLHYGMDHAARRLAPASGRSDDRSGQRAEVAASRGRQMRQYAVVEQSPQRVEEHQLPRTAPGAAAGQAGRGPDLGLVADSGGGLPRLPLLVVGVVTALGAAALLRKRHQAPSATDRTVDSVRAAVGDLTPGMGAIGAVLLGGLVGRLRAPWR